LLAYLGLLVLCLRRTARAPVSPHAAIKPMPPGSGVAVAIELKASPTGSGIPVESRVSVPVVAILTMPICPPSCAGYRYPAESNASPYGATTGAKAVITCAGEVFALKQGAARVKHRRVG